jgi:hypothetical protein
MLYSFWTNYDDSVTEAYEIENAPACVGKSLARSVLQSSMNFEDDTQPVNDDQVMASVIERELNMDPTTSTTSSSSSSSPVSPLAPLAPVAPAAASSPALPTTADQEQDMKLNHLLASKTKKMEKIRGSSGKY